MKNYCCITEGYAGYKISCSVSLCILDSAFVLLWVAIGLMECLKDSPVMRCQNIQQQNTSEHSIPSGKSQNLFLTASLYHQVTKHNILNFKCYISVIS